MSSAIAFTSNAQFQNGLSIAANTTVTGNVTSTVTSSRLLTPPRDITKATVATIALNANTQVTGLGTVPYNQTALALGGMTTNAASAIVVPIPGYYRVALCLPAEGLWLLVVSGNPVMQFEYAGTTAGSMETTIQAEANDTIAIMNGSFSVQPVSTGATLTVTLVGFPYQ